MKVKALQKAIKARKKDNGSDFAVGSVIRWVVVTEGLVYRLSKEEVVEICFATDWEVVDV